MEKRIKDIYDIIFDPSDIPTKDRYPIHEWYYSLINKTYEQLNLVDVTRMIIQNVFLELAIPKAIEFLNDDPFCGERYEGELLELLFRLDYIHLSKYQKDICNLLLNACNKNVTYIWVCEEEREEYFKLIKAFKAKICGDGQIRRK